MENDEYSGGSMKRIEVDPADVRVVTTEARSYGAPPPPSGAPIPLLRRHRAKLALGLAIVELLVLGFGPGDLLRSWVGLLAIAAAAVFVQIVVSRYLPYSVRQITWMIALAQALVALFPVFLGVSIVIVVVLLVFAVLTGLALLLGERS